jgi:hypothetical protein
MKTGLYFVVALLLSTAPALAQDTFVAGQHVEVLNPMNEKWEPATVTGVTGTGVDLQYNVHSDTPGVDDTPVLPELMRVPAVETPAPAPIVSASVVTNGVPSGVGGRPSGSGGMNGDGTFTNDPASPVTP